MHIYEKLNFIKVVWLLRALDLVLFSSFLFYCNYKPWLISSFNTFTAFVLIRQDRICKHKISRYKCNEQMLQTDKDGEGQDQDDHTQLLIPSVGSVDFLQLWHLMFTTSIVVESMKNSGKILTPQLYIVLITFQWEKITNFLTESCSEFLFVN